MTELLRAVAICKTYGPLAVLKNVTLSVEQKEIFAIIGPNGAGKTTLFKTMTGESIADAGRIIYAGEDVTKLSAPGRVRRGMGRTFQVARIFRDFSVQQNIIVTIESRRRGTGESMGAFFRTAPSREIVDEADELIDELDLGHVRHKEATFLSHGDKKRLEFLIALALRPRILMLDEPTAGMSPTDRTRIARLIQEIRDQKGITVVMTEHDMDIVFGLADRVMVLNYGEIIAVGTVDEIRGNEDVANVYLGTEMYRA